MSRAATREKPPASAAKIADRARLRRRFVAALLGLALGTFLALALSPRSHWLVRTQVSGWMPPLPVRQAGEDAEQRRDPDPISDADLGRAAARLSNDGAAQSAYLAYRLQGADGPGTRDIPRVVALARRFPNDPAVQAAALRLAWAGGARMDEADIRPLLEIARVGQRLDPKNAFFPAMRWGLLSQAKQEQPALAALMEAAALPRWDVYVVEQVHGAWRLSDMASGKDNTAGRAMLTLAASFPYLRSFVEGSTAASRLAAAREADGYLEDGYAIRRALLRLGERIRGQDSTYIGALVGITVQQNAIRDLPGEGKPLRGEDRDAFQRKAFDAYLRRVAAPGDIAWTHRQYAAWSARLQIMRAISELSGLADRRSQIEDRLLPFSGWYRAGAFLLKAALWVGLAALAAALLARWRWANTIVGGYRELAVFCVVAMSLLLLTYGFVSLQTLRAATQTNRNLARIVQNESRFYATLTGQPWPQ
jgi:hypothetical protein